MTVRRPANEGVLRYLERNSAVAGVPEVRAPREQQRDYWECGSHPDVVERVWDQLGKSLPAECRKVVLGSPALVHPESGVVLAIAIGTQYGLRLPTSALRDGLPNGARTLTVWAGGARMDIQEEFGRDWIFGTWSVAEETWCLEAFRERGGGRRDAVRRLSCSALLFDMDGVLLDSRAVVERTWRRWARRHGLEAEPFLRVAHGRRGRDTLHAVAPELATDEEVAWLDAAELEDLEGLVPVAGAADLVSVLPPTRWTVVTSAGRELAGRRLAAAGLTLPAHAVTSEDVCRGKPAPDGYRLGADRLGVAACECVVVEDSPPGIEAGRAAGAMVLAVSTTHPPEALAGADVVVGDLRCVRVSVGVSGLEVVVEEPAGET